MSRLLLFNPENDLALAADERNYTPRAHAAALHRAGALLPAWWAGHGDLLLAPAGSRADLEAIRSQYGLNGEIATPEAVAEMVTECEPWGWSLDAKRQFMAAGVPEARLPDDATLGRWRELSHRRSAVWLNRYIAGEMPETMLPRFPEIYTDAEAAMSLIESLDKACYVKAPWSSSGRGVFVARSMPSATLRGQIAGIVRRQGAVIIEPALDRTADFAALYYCRDGVPGWGGWSVFMTAERCAYVGNLVATQPVLQALVSDMINPVDAGRLVEVQLEGLTRLLAGSGYTGWLGVDMLTYRDVSGRNRLDACVEINLRRTMGVVAMELAGHFCPDRPMTYSVEYNAGSQAGRHLLVPREGFSFKLF